MKAILYLTALFFLLFAGSSCQKRPGQGTQFPPADIHFQLQKGGKPYPDSILQQVVCFYYNKEGNYIDRPGAAFDSHLDDQTFCYWDSGAVPQGLLRLRYLIDISAQQQVRDFYLKLPNGDIDTLWLQAVQTSEGPYWSTMQQLTFNGVPVSAQQQGYIFYFIFHKN